MSLLVCAVALAAQLGFDASRTKQAAAAVEALADSEEEAKDFMVLVALESGFNPFARSGKGAHGLSQLTEIGVSEVKTKGGFKCRLTAAPSTPLGNLEHGICYFRLAKERWSGSTTLALIDYNAGRTQAGDFKRSLKASSEPTSYVARHAYLRKEVCK